MNEDIYILAHSYLTLRYRIVSSSITGATINYLFKLNVYQTSTGHSLIDDIEAVLLDEVSRLCSVAEH